MPLGLCVTKLELIKFARLLLQYKLFTSYSNQIVYI